MKRLRIELVEIAELSHLVRAYHRAAMAKRSRAEVLRFNQRLFKNLNILSDDIQNERLPYGGYRAFQIRDPKLRTIHAACFADRVFHHALMGHVGPVLERAMVASSYACRPKMGVHQAIKKVQSHLRKYAYYVKTDVDQYFPSINHTILLTLLERRFKGVGIIRQFERIVCSYRSRAGYGLPIGSLCSQYFANYYLDAGDRFLMNHPLVRAHIRYMDDVLFWCDSRESARRVLQDYIGYLHRERDLRLKTTTQIQPSRRGVRFCGFAISLGTIRLSRRRQRRYQQRRCYWEQAYAQGQLCAAQLQQAYASVLAITQGADSLAWRQRQLALHPARDI